MVPYLQDGHITLWHGDCREVLSGLPAASVHYAMTSPPYWGLRDYGLPPSIWGGQAVGCQHDWGTEKKAREQSGRQSLAWYTGGNPAAKIQSGPVSQGAHCHLCAAWQGCLGLEPAPEMYVAHLLEIFRAVLRVLRDDGTLWLNLSSGYQNKQLLALEWDVAKAMQKEGWWLRSAMTLCKVNPMPESVTDRPTTATQMMFLLTKQAQYYYDAEAIREPWADDRMGGNQTKSLRYSKLSGRNGDSGLGPAPGFIGRNLRNWWPVVSEGYAGQHFATFGQQWIEPCLLAGTSAAGCCVQCGAPWKRTTEKGALIQQNWAPGTQQKIDAAQGKHGRTSVMNTGFTRESHTTGWRPGCACAAGPPVPCTVLDPFCGTATTGVVAARHGRTFVGIDLSQEYLELARKRLTNVQVHLPFGVSYDAPF